MGSVTARRKDIGAGEDGTRVELLRDSALAMELTPGQCATLAQLVSVRALADGEVLVKQGASDDRLFVITSGSLAVARWREDDRQWSNIHLLSKGDLAGELGFMDGRPHFAALRAMGPTRLLCLARQDLESLLKSEPEIVYQVMRAILRVVHVVLNRVAMQASELTNYIYKVHGKY